MTEAPGSEEPGSARAELDEVLQAGPSRVRWFDRLVASPPREWTRRSVRLGVGVGVAMIAIAITAVVAMNSAREPVARPADHDVAQVSMAEVRALAAEGGRFADYVRQSSQAGGCALVTVGMSPGRAISAAVHKALPQYTVKDAGVTLDQFTGLCSIEVRATYRAAVLVVGVASPSAHAPRASYTRLETGIETNGDRTTKYAFAVNEAGWTVLVGATGRTGDLPTANDLVQLAQQPSLTW